MLKHMLIGCHVGSEDPVAEGLAAGAEIVQITLGDPQKWTAPAVLSPGGGPALRAAAADAGIKLVVHAAYLINVASTNNRVRIPSRQLLQKTLNAAAEIGALGVVVHGGHLTAEDDPGVGVDNWVKAISGLEFAVPLFIENTAGGNFAMARYLDAWRRLWAGVASADGEGNVGVCLDTCHAFCAGLDLTTVVDDLRAITGRIDLVHANDSRDAAGSGADRHANIGQGQIDPSLIATVVRQADAPTVVETPGPVGAWAADIDWLREQVR